MSFPTPEILGMGGRTEAARNTFQPKSTTMTHTNLKIPARGRIIFGLNCTSSITDQNFTRLYLRSYSSIFAFSISFFFWGGGFDLAVCIDRPPPFPRIGRNKSFYLKILVYIYFNIKSFNSPPPSFSSMTILCTSAIEIFF